MQPPAGLPTHPADLIPRWPANRPLACVRRPAEDGALWTIFGTSDCASVHATDDPALIDDPVGRLNRMLAPSAEPSGGQQSTDLPFRSGWIAAFGYELGRLLEPAVRHPNAHRPPSAAVTLHRCSGALIHRMPNPNRPEETGSWHASGEVPEDLGRAEPGDALRSLRPLRTGAESWTLTDDAYRLAVTRVLQLIGAGDAYQVNLTRQLSCPFTGSARHLAAAALRTANPAHGAIIETPDARTIISMSPELFLDVCPSSRRVRSRPIKGTRPAEESPDELTASVKDTAELTMIIDLMRNDLGRICTPGSVRVTRRRYIETHGTVHHGVAEVAGDLREGIGIGEMLAAAFAPGSVTGAPRIRAMQIIEELEPEPRGAYCGAIGMIDDGGGVCLNVAIRTMELSGVRRGDAFDLTEGTLRYGSGGGIVADSCPDAELEETQQKTRVLRTALAAAAQPEEPAASAPPAVTRTPAASLRIHARMRNWRRRSRRRASSGPPSPPPPSRKNRRRPHRLR